MPTISFQAAAQVNAAIARVSLAGIGALVQVEIHVPNALAALLVQNQQQVPPPVVGYALIDTGATSSCVDDAVMRQLGVNTIGTIPVAGAAGANVHALYPARFVIPPGIGDFNFGAVISVDLTPIQVPGAPHVIALLGRDILSLCVFVYNGPQGSFSLSL